MTINNLPSNNSKYSAKRALFNKIGLKKPRFNHNKNIQFKDYKMCRLSRLDFNLFFDKTMEQSLDWADIIIRNTSRQNFFYYSHPKSFLEDPISYFSRITVQGNIQDIISFLRQKIQNIEGIENPNTASVSQKLKNTFKSDTNSYFSSNFEMVPAIYPVSLQNINYSDNPAPLNELSSNIQTMFDKLPGITLVSRLNYVIISSQEIQRISDFIKKHENETSLLNSSFSFFTYKKNYMDKYTSILPLEISSEDITKQWLNTRSSKLEVTFNSDNTVTLHSNFVFLGQKNKATMNIPFNIFYKAIHNIKKDILNQFPYPWNIEYPKYPGDYVHNLIYDHINAIDNDKNIQSALSNLKLETLVATLKLEQDMLNDNPIHEHKHSVHKF